MPYPRPNDLDDITFLTCEDVIQIHASLLLSGPLEGVKDRNGLTSAVGHALNAAYYNPAADMEYLAATFGINFSRKPTQIDMKTSE